MHPIERLRSVAQASGVPEQTLIREVAAGLSSLVDDHQTLVMACRRMVADHPASGAVLWLAARMLLALDARSEAWAVLSDFEADPTDSALADAFPEGADVVALGSCELVGPALGRRADVGSQLVGLDSRVAWLERELNEIGCTSTEIPLSAAGPAVEDADLVVIEANAVGPTHALASAGARPVAAVANHAGVPVWLVVGVGRVLPQPMWDAMVARQAEVDLWDLDVELLPLDLVDQVVGSSGMVSVARALQRPNCPTAHELT